MRLTHLLKAASIFLMAIGTIPIAEADSSSAIKLNFTSYDSMNVRDCLRVISMETGQIVLPDATVNGYVGPINMTEPDIPSVLNYLKTYEPGLTYQVVYFPNGPDEPDGEQLHQQIQALKSSTIPGFVLLNPTDTGTMITFRADQNVTPDTQQKAIAGMREIYLVSDSSVRAQMNKKPLPTSAPASTVAQLPGTATADFQPTLDAIVQQIAQMSPQQQVAAMAALAAAQQQINRSLAPSALSYLRNEHMPRRRSSTAPGAHGE